MSIEDRQHAVQQAKFLAQACPMLFGEFFMREDTGRDGDVMKVCIVCGQLQALHRRKLTRPLSPPQLLGPLIYPRNTVCPWKCKNVALNVLH